jgi:hypothetical protein
VLRAYTGIYSPAAEDAFFVFNIDPAGGFIGSGIFDGDGIPANFFSDIHARRAFNHAFDFATYKAYLEGIDGTTPIQRTGPIIKDLPGYNDGQPVYTYDPILALQELQQAWGGQAVANGFRMTLPYDTGNTMRQTVVETIKAGIEALDPKFQIDVVEIPWSEYLSAQRTGQMPLYVSGWIQDYAHPHNWVVPYLTGTNASRQQFPPALLAKYQGKVAACLLLSGTAARTCYQDIQINTHQDAPGIYLFQRTSTSYVRAEVGGFEASGLNFGTASGAPAFFSLWKSGLPVSGEVVPGTTAVIEATSSSGATVNLEFPTGAVVQDTQLVIIPDVNALNRTLDETRQMMMGENKLSRFAFEVGAFDGTGQAINTLILLNPAKLTLRYTNLAITPLNEDGLVIMRWDGTGWVDGACGPYQRDPSKNTLTAPVCMTGLFAVGGVVNELFLPVVIWR